MTRNFGCLIGKPETHAASRSRRAALFRLALSPSWRGALRDEAIQLPALRLPRDNQAETDASIK